MVDKSIILPNLPEYQGRNWVKATLPNTPCDWLAQDNNGWILDPSSNAELIDQLNRLSHEQAWSWPDRTILFITDLHADAEAFASSLVASGLFTRYGESPNDITLIDHPPPFELIIGGDCLDKGPANLPLLRLLRQLLDQQIPITLLSGNHDLRLQLAINTLKTPDCPLNAHFLIRLGSKVMPFCVELLSEYPLSSAEKATLPSDEYCAQRLLPSHDWHIAFSQAAKPYLSDSQIDTEISRLASRKQRFFNAAQAAHLSMQDIYAALLRWRQLFLEPQGEFYWFTQQQQLLCRRGSFIFLHAGCDDVMVKRLTTEGVDVLNHEFSQARQGDAFQLYFSHLGNMLRTKYRRQDPALRSDSRQALYQAGIHAFVHGHRNLHQGQRITFRANMMHVECDATLNQVSRREEGLSGLGAAVTLFYPEGWMVGISSDFPQAKYFHPRQLNRLANRLHHQL